jgi:hypothetical protein
MRIFLICSKKFYPRVPEVLRALEADNHVVELPNSYTDPAIEERYKKLGIEEHAKWKAEMLRRSTDIIEKNDAVLVLNFEKDGVKNYIGGATFLEMHDAFRLGKTIFLFNAIPDGILRDEIISFSPKIINGDLSKVK